MSVNCRRCDLHKFAKHVFIASKGSDTPILLFVGEAGGDKENEKGVCFVGPAGKKLDELLKLTGISESWYRVSNICRCTPWANPKNPRSGVRPPTDIEIAACSPYLEQEILATEPLYIIPLGLTATKFFLPGTSKLGAARGILHTVEIPSLQTRVRKILAWLKIHPNPVLEKLALKAKTVTAFKDTIHKAEKLGFPVIPTTEFQVWPTYHPAAILRGHNDTFEQSMIGDLKYVKSLIDNVGKEQTNNYTLCTTIEEIKQRCAGVSAQFRTGKIKFITLDVETTCLNHWLSSYPDLLLFSISTGDETFTVPYNHPESMFWCDQLSLAAINGIVNDLLEVVSVVNQNLKFDAHWLRAYGIEIKHIAGDTMLAAWTLFNDNGPKDLETLATRYTPMINHKEKLHRAQAALPKWVELEQRWLSRLGTLTPLKRGCHSDQVPLPFPLPGADSRALKERTPSQVPPNGFAASEHAEMAQERAREGTSEHRFSPPSPRGLTPNLGIDIHTTEMVYRLPNDLRQDKKTGVVYRSSHMGDLPLDLVHSYCAADAHSTYLLHQVFEKMLADAGLLEPHRAVTVEAILPTIEMEKYGVKIDVEVLRKAKLELEAKLQEQHTWFDRYSDQIKQIVEESAGDYGKPIEDDVNIASTRAKRVLLFEILGLRPTRFTEKQQPSVDRIYLSEVKANLEEDEACLDERDKERLEVVRRIIDMNRDGKILTSYVAPIVDVVDKDNVTHPSYGIRTTETGRFTCRGQPLIHGIPRKSVVKSAFIPHDPLGLIMISDLSQIEIKVLASETQDERLLQCFAEGKDIHRLVASITLGKSEEEITKEERSRLKAVTFGISFGRGAQAIATQENIPVAQAQEAIDKFFTEFPKIQDWVREQHRLVRKNMEVWIASGFRRTFAEGRFEPDELDRRSVNTKIQGPAATIMTLILIQTQKRLRALRKHRYKSHVWASIHDSLCFSIAPNELLLMAKLAKSTMEDWPNKHIDWMLVPVTTEIEVGVSWGDLLSLTLLDNNRTEIKGTWERFSKFKRNVLRWSQPPTIESVTKEEGVGDDGKPVAVAKAILKWRNYNGTE